MKKEFDIYFKLLIPACLLMALVLVIVNIRIDIFGVFGYKKNTRVYGEERISKYLMGFRYIPENFEGVILGPSLSANIDPAPIDHMRYYNASLMGARIQTILPLLENIVASDHKIRRAWVCIHPYMTQRDAESDNQLMRPEAYWSAFGSIHLLRVYFFALVRWLKLAPYKYPQNQYLANGTNNFEALFKVPDVSAKIEEEKALLRQEDFDIYPSEKSSLRELWRLLESNKIQTTVYFHPVPKPILEANKEKFTTYWQCIKSTSSGEEKGITFKNFNQNEFSFFTEDISNYIDHGHLSEKGQKLLLKEIIKE